MEYNKTITSIRNVVKNIPALDDISDLLYSHNCFYLLSLYKNKYSEKILLQNVANQCAIMERFKVLQPLLSKADFSYALVKGPMLSKLAYNSPFMRLSADVDILVDKKDCDKIKNLLYEEGFIQGRVVSKEIIPYSRKEIIFQSISSHQIAQFVHATNNKLCPYVIVDVNTDIYWGESKKAIDIGKLLEKTIKQEICGFHFNFLETELHFILLCLHHYKDLNSLFLLATRGIKLETFSDIYFFIKNQKLDLYNLKKLASTLNASKYVYYCIYYTHCIFNDEILLKLLDLFEFEKDAELINCYGLCAEERKNWTISFPERLFCENISEYIRASLTVEEVKKIHINRLLM